MQENEIEQLMNRDLSELYEEFGRSVLGQPAFPLPSEELVRAAKEWLERRRSEIQSIVCSDKVRRVVSGKKQQTQIDLAVLITNIIALELSSVPAGTLAVILVREGLTRFCGWREDTR